MSSPETATADDLPLSFGRYTLLSVLGTGGMGRVFRAALTGPSGFRKEVALKVISPKDPDALAEIRAALADEARIGGLLRHPNVVDVYDFGEAEGRPFISMELVAGLDLQALSARARLAPAHVVQIGAAIAAGLHHAHELEVDGRRAGLVHRDLKPTNVLVSRDGVVKVMDFGIARLTSDVTRTEEGIAKGTPAFMSPEQAAAEPLDQRSDLWSLGAVLWQLATGDPLLPGSTIIEVMMSLLQAPDRLQRPGAFDPVDTVVPGLGAVLASLLRRDPEERPPDAAAVEARLLALLPTLPPAPTLRSLVRDVLAGGDGQDLAAMPTRVAVAGLSSTLDDGPPTNLRPEGNSFLGRDDDLERVTGLLLEHPLVTLLGPAGTGKSRLSREVARRFLPRVPAGGAWFVALDDARTLEDIVAAVAHALSLRLGDLEPDEQAVQVGRALAGRGPTVLVLDNFEQLLRLGGATVARWQALAPDLRLLVTSRERLRLPGERVVPLGPLAEDDAARLFVDRATAARPTFSVPDDQQEILRDVVRRLDAIPLAVELAAARVAVLPLPRLAERLSQRFRLLRTRSSDPAAARRATLEGAIAWSWDLLEPAEQHTLAWCSVFRGGFTVELAEQFVDLSEHPDDPWVLDTLEALRDKSLLRVIDTERGPRFATYESIGAFASARLAERADSNEAPARHAEALLRWVEPMSARVSVHGGPAAMAAIGDEMENLVAAWDWSAQHAPGLAVGLCLALELPLRRRGPGSLHRRIVEGSVALAEHASLLDRARLAAAHSQLLRLLDRADDALAAAWESVRLAEEAGDPLLAAEHAVGLGYSLRGHARVPEVEPRLQEAVTWLRSAAAPASSEGLLGRVLSSLASAVGYAGRQREERSLRREALIHHEAVGDVRMVASESANLAVLMATAGAVEEAEPLFVAAVRGCREAGDRMSEQVALANRGTLYAELGKVEEAERTLLRAEQKGRALGADQLLPLLSCNLGLLAMCAGRHSEARRRLTEADRQFGRRQADERLVALTSAYLGVLDLLEGDAETALERLRPAIAAMEGTWAKRDHGMCLGILAAAEARLGNEEGALAALDRGRAAGQRMEDEDTLLLVTLGEGHVELLRSDRAAARGDHEDAALLRELAEARLDMAPIDGVVRATMARIGHRLLREAVAARGAAT